MHGLKSLCRAAGMSKHHGHCEVKEPAPGVTLLPRALVGWARHVCGLLFGPLFLPRCFSQPAQMLPYSLKGRLVLAVWDPKPLLWV